MTIVLLDHISVTVESLCHHLQSKPFAALRWRLVLEVREAEQRPVGQHLVLNQPHVGSSSHGLRLVLLTVRIQTEVHCGVGLALLFRIAVQVGVHRRELGGGAGR